MFYDWPATAITKPLVTSGLANACRCSNVLPGSQKHIAFLTATFRDFEYKALEANHDLKVDIEKTVEDIVVGFYGEDVCREHVSVEISGMLENSILARVTLQYSDGTDVSAMKKKWDSHREYLALEMH